MRLRQSIKSSGQLTERETVNCIRWQRHERLIWRVQATEVDIPLYASAVQPFQASIEVCIAHRA